LAIVACIIPETISSPAPPAITSADAVKVVEDEAILAVFEIKQLKIQLNLKLHQILLL
jgi:hypothetical protein